MLMARERFCRFQGGGFGETREAPGLGICCCSGAFGGDKSTQPSAPLQCRPFSPTVRGAEFSRSGAASSRYLRGFGLRSGATANPSLPAEAPRDALAGLGEAEHPSRPACPPVPSAVPQALLPRERMVESRGSADKLMAPIGRLGLTCRSKPDSSKARACSRAGSRGESCSETQT